MRKSSFLLMGIMGCLLVTVLILSGGIAAADPLLQEGATPTLPIGTYAPPSEETVTPIPPYAAEIEPPEGDDILNILLLGSDTSTATNAGRTDAIMIASINRTQGSVNLLSIPRDLFVYIPGWTMQRINTAFGHGEHTEGYEEGGYGLLKETILYNLGIPIDFYARVDFNDFQYIVDALGGVEITVDCAIQDWQLKTPGLDPTVEDNWELVTLPVGVHMLDGYTALWYARSRRTSSDFDRGRRQQDLIRAMYRRMRGLGLFSQVPGLWGQATEIVETDMQLQDIAGLLPLALSMDVDRIAHYTFRSGVHTQSWSTPAGSSVLLPVPEAVQGLVYNFMRPATTNRLVQQGSPVEVVNASGYNNLDRVAADRLAWEGFAAYAVGTGDEPYHPQTVVYDYSGRTKGSTLATLLLAMRLDESAIVVEPDPDRTVDYRIVLGGDFRSCSHNVMPPVATPIPEQAAEGSAADS